MIKFYSKDIEENSHTGEVFVKKNVLFFQMTDENESNYDDVATERQRINYSGYLNQFLTSGDKRKVAVTFTQVIEAEGAEEPVKEA